MLPRWHIFLGAIFTLAIWAIFPETEWYNLTLVFLSSFLIDFDHYLVAVRKTGKLGLFSAFDYYEKLRKIFLIEQKKKIFKRGDLQIFHTIEFHLLILALGFLFVPFFYVFIGMVFHSLIDVIDMSRNGALHKREFLFVNWLKRRL